MGNRGKTRIGAIGIQLWVGWIAGQATLSMALVGNFLQWNKDARIKIWNPQGQRLGAWDGVEGHRMAWPPSGLGRVPGAKVLLRAHSDP